MIRKIPFLILLLMTASPALSQAAPNYANDPNLLWEHYQWFNEAASVTTCMVLIPQGDYWIGTTEEEIKRYLKEIGSSDTVCFAFHSAFPRHLVHLESFYIREHEVSNKEYKTFIDATGHSPPQIETDITAIDLQFAWRNGTYPPGRGAIPVKGIKKADAEYFCQWRTEATGILHRLPTEEEWEATYRGKEERLFPWGHRWDRPRFVSVQRNYEVGPDPFYSFFHFDDITPEGVQFMLGNVREFTSSFYLPYPAPPGSLSPSESKALANVRFHVRPGRNSIVLRGAGFDDKLRDGFPAYRRAAYELYSDYNVGFRYVIPVKDGKPVRVEPVKKNQTQ